MDRIVLAGLDAGIEALACSNLDAIENGGGHPVAGTRNYSNSRRRSGNDGCAIGAQRNG
jgi:hypothetical protein